MLLGSHLSIGGGLHLALEKAHEFKFDTTAMFVRGQAQWHVPVLTAEAVRLFRETREKLGISPIVAHGSYLVNLAGRKEVRDKSLVAMAADLARCRRLGIEFLVMHPGANEDAKRGVEMIAAGLDEIYERLSEMAGDPANEIDSAVPWPRVLLETTAGCGNSIGGTFEQLAGIIAHAAQGDRLGVCLDTCHVFAAGHDFRTPEGYAAMMEHFDREIGLDRLFAIHLNDSKRELGSHVDRHAHIGKGEIGLSGFRSFVNDPRLAMVPMILETPKGLREKDGRDWDRVNAQAVRRLVKKGR